MFFCLGGPLPLDASQDVEHNHAKAGQQQAQHVGQDTLRLESAVLGPAGSRWEEPPKGSPFSQMPFAPGPERCDPSPTIALGGELHRELAQKTEVQGSRTYGSVSVGTTAQDTHPSLNSSASFRPSRAVPTERRKMVAPKKTCCGR